MQIDPEADATGRREQYGDRVERRLVPPRNDVLLVAGILVLVGLEQFFNAAVAPKWAAAPIEVAAVVALAWRRRFPLATTCVASGGIALEAVAGVPIQEPFVPLLVVVVSVYSLVVHAPATRVLAGLAIVGVGLAVTVTSQHRGVGNFAFGALWVAGAVFVGRLVRARIDDAREHERRAEKLEWQREEHMRLAAEEERKRIARELHDVIAHSLSVMVVQAGAAEEMLRHDPARAQEPVLSIQETGRDALAEMSRLLGVLREGGDEVGLTPQPSLADLGTLLEETRVAGVAVGLSIEGGQRPLPPGIELSAYRIVQEALTNARRHAGGARADVTLRYMEDALEVDVLDDGIGRGSATANGDAPAEGFGLVGMRERVSVYGGSLETGPRPDGGFGVHARLPLTAAT